MRKTFVKDINVIWREQDGAEGSAPVPVQRIPTASVMTNVTDPVFRTFANPQGNSDAFWATHGPVPHRVVNWTAIIICPWFVILLGIGLGILIRRWQDSRKVEEQSMSTRDLHM